MVLAVDFEELALASTIGVDLLKGGMAKGVLVGDGLAEEGFFSL